MPQLAKPGSEPTRAEKLRAVTVEDIQDTYRRGYITAGDRNRLVREKAHATVGELLDEKGFFGAVFSQTIQNVQKGWDNLKEAAIREPTGEVRTELYYTGLAMWGQIQILTSALNAVGEVTGQVAENTALRAGASPGLAKAIGIAADVGTGLVPVGLGAKSLAKGVQAFGKARQAKQAAKAAGTAEQVATRVLAEGLEAEGVKGASKIMSEATAAAGKGAKEGAPAIRLAEEGAGAAAKTVQEQFAADLTKFQGEMKAITATQAHEETARLANKLGLSLDDLKNVVPGQALDEKQMYAYLKALEPQVDELVSLAKRVISEGTEEAANALARHASELFTTAPIFRGAEVTAGRAVEILKETPPMKKLTDMLMGWDPESIAKGDFQGAIMTMAEDIAALTPEKAQALAVIGQSGWQRFAEKGWPMIRSTYTNLLLARPLTHVRNFAGNTIAATNNVLERQLGAAFSIDKQAGLVGKEAVYQAKGMMLALGDGLKAFADAFRTLGPEEISKLDYVPAKLPGVAGRILGAPGDALIGMDNFFKTILRRGSYYAQAVRDGAHRGLEGKSLADFIARRVNNPTQKMLAEAEDVALSATFQNELGTMGRAVQKTLQTGLLALWFPFMKTPMNLAKYAWNRTPGLQLVSKSLYEDILAGGVKADMAIGRLTLSNMMGMFLFELAKDGMITGSGPADPALKRAWLATHEPYSVKTKDGWIPISNTEPGSTTLGMVADLAQILNQLDEPTAEQASMAVAFTIMHDLADKTYWQTVGDLVDIGSGVAHGEAPRKGLVDVAAGPVKTVLTGGPLISSVARAVDPIRREARGFVDGLVARVPGYSKTLPPMRDGYGDPILPPQAIGGPWVGIASPLTLKPDEQDRVKREGARLEIKLPRFPDTIGGPVRDDFDIRAPFPEDKLGVELTPQQRDRWQVINRNILRHAEHGIQKQLLDNPTYQRSTRAAQREMFMDYMADIRATARDALTVEDTGLGKKLLENDATSIAPLLQTEDRSALESQVRESINLFDTLSQEQRDNLQRWGILGEEESNR